MLIKLMQKEIYLSIFSVLVLLGIVLRPSLNKNSDHIMSSETVRAAKFEELSQNGNSSCSAAFTQSIDDMSSGERLQGSCCSQMDIHRYSEQVEGLKKFSNILEIPSDPYDIDIELARKLKSYYDLPLTAEQQRAYDYAMEHSHEKGPCCCKCWRWYVYGGLGKLLITKYNFTGEQVTELWDLSDGCGGAGDHAH
jgi:hypothetical protein